MRKLHVIASRWQVNKREWNKLLTRRLMGPTEDAIIGERTHPLTFVSALSFVQRGSLTILCDSQDDAILQKFSDNIASRNSI